MKSSLLTALSFLFASAHLSYQSQFVYERDTNSTVPPLVNFQVQQPPPHPINSKGCTVQLIQHNFANSYYQYAFNDYTVGVSSVDA